MKYHVLDGTRLTLGSLELNLILSQDNVNDVQKYILKFIEADRKKKNEKLSFLEKQFHILDKEELRRCFVDGDRAWFHRWIDKETPISKINRTFSREELEKILYNIKSGSMVAPLGIDILLQKRCYGLIEYEDGTVEEVEPTSIRFDVECR